jgi:hypothetical protein
MKTSIDHPATIQIPPTPPLQKGGAMLYPPLEKGGGGDFHGNCHAGAAPISENNGPGIFTNSQPATRNPPPTYLWLLVAALLCTACGYRLTGEGLGPRPELRRIAIPVFENSTSEAGLETVLASDLRQQFILRSRFQVVPVEQSEAVFRGHIIKLYTTDIAHRQAEQTIESRVYITLDIRCEDPRTGEVLWQDRNMTYFKEYLHTADPMVTYANRRRAEAVIARDLAVRIHDRFLSNF